MYRGLFQLLQLTLQQYCSLAVADRHRRSVSNPQIECLLARPRYAEHFKSSSSDLL